MIFRDCQRLRLPYSWSDDVTGFRLIAISLLPISGDTIVMGSHDGGHTVHNDDTVLAGLMQRAATTLNIKPHPAGLDPDNLPFADKNDMNFGSSGMGGDNQKKAWKDIWGSGQGIGSIKEITSVKDTVDKLVSEYQSSKHRLDKIS